MDLIRRRAAAGAAELGSVRWSAVAAALAVAAAAGLLDLSGRVVGPGSLLVWLAAGCLGAGALAALEEPAEDVATAAPTPTWCRWGARGSVVLLAALAWVLLAWRVGAVLGAAGATLSVAALVVVGLGLEAVSVGLATALVRAGRWEAGPDLAPVVVLLALGLALVRLPGGVVAYDVSAWTAVAWTWTALGVAGLAVTVGTLRR